MWIVEYNCPGQAVQSITAYDCEDYALVAACSSIMLVVIHEWDRTDTSCHRHALKVSDACANLNWREAMRLFNDWECNGNVMNMQNYRVYELVPKTTLPTVHLLSPTQVPPAPSVPTMPSAKLAPPTAWKATAPGATCRGPCKQVSMDAYADQPDGTYHCYQCKMFSQVFGKPKP